MSVQIFNVLGAHIATLVDDEVVEAADHSIVWNGQSEGGDEVAAGVYFCRVKANETILTRKMLKLNQRQ